MKTTVSKSWSFDAAHQLPNHDGKCAQPHGHTYTVQVAVAGYPQPIDGRPQEGMVVDFAVLDRIWKRLEPVLDHRDLNHELRNAVPRTTSELLAAWIFKQFAGDIGNDGPGGVHVEFVRVSETPKTYAEVRA